MTLEEYLLVCLAEEASEVGQAACKCLRFKSKRVWAGKNGTNLELLVGEINDLLAIVEMLSEEGVVLRGLNDRAAVTAKKKRVMAVKKQFEEAEARDS